MLCVSVPRKKFGNIKKGLTPIDKYSSRCRISIMEVDMGGGGGGGGGIRWDTDHKVGQGV